MLGKMPGAAEERLANLRAYYGFMWGHRARSCCSWGRSSPRPRNGTTTPRSTGPALDDPRHAGVQRLVRDLNTLYRDLPALHARDCDPDGFQWIEADDAARSVYAWIRRGGADDPNVVVVSNFTPVERAAYRLGLPFAGPWRVALNTDAAIYGGGDRGPSGSVDATPTASHGQAASADLVVPPLSTLFLVQDR